MMALRIASRRVNAIFSGSTPVLAIGSKVHRRNATAVAVPTSSLPDEVRESILVNLTVPKGTQTC